MMKKLLMLTAVLVSLNVLGFCCIHPIFAQESDVTIGFEAGSGAVPPLNPDDPTQPLESGDMGTGESGSLALNYISPIAFGTHTVSSVEQIYNSTTLKPFVQVTDLRGTGSGWELRATAGLFENAEGATINGAILTFLDGEPLSAVPGAAPPMCPNEISLPADGTSSAIIMSAGNDEGKGTWLCRWYPETGPNNDAITLTIPAAIANIGNYTSSVLWSLVDAP